MNYKPYVCTICSQDFTRKYSGHRHNRDLHKGQSKIVRMVDYVVGRNSGEYHPGIPLAYRSKQKRYNPAGNHSDVMSGSFPFAFIAHNSPKGDFTTYAKNEVRSPNQQLDINSVQHSTDSTQAATSKLNEILRLCQTLHFQPQFTEAFLKRLSLEVIKNGGKEAIFDICLEQLQNNLNMMEASRYLLCSSTCEVKSTSRVPLHNHHVEGLPESTKAKLAQIDQVLTGSKHEAFVWEDIEHLIKKCKSAADHSFLDRELESYQRTISGHGLTRNEIEDKIFFSPEEGREQIHSSPFSELGRLPWSNDGSTETKLSCISNADLESDLKGNGADGLDPVIEVPISEQGHQQVARKGPDKNWTTRRDEEEGVYTKIDYTKTVGLGPVIGLANDSKQGQIDENLDWKVHPDAGLDPSKKDQSSRVGGWRASELGKSANPVGQVAGARDTMGPESIDPRSNNNNLELDEYEADLTKIQRSPEQVKNGDFVIGNYSRIVTPNSALAEGNKYRKAGKPRFPRPSRLSRRPKHEEGHVKANPLNPGDIRDMLIPKHTKHEAERSVEVGPAESSSTHQLSGYIPSMEEEQVVRLPGEARYAADLDITEMMNRAMGLPFQR